MLYALVLANGALEDHALPRVAGGPSQRVLAAPDGFDPDENTLGIEAVQQISEPLAFLSDPVFLTNEEAVDEDRVRVHCGAAHLRDLAHIDPGSIQIGVEDRHSVRRPGALLESESSGSEA